MWPAETEVVVSQPCLMCCQSLCLGARLRYNLEVDENVKKLNEQTNNLLSLALSLSYCVRLHSSEQGKKYLLEFKITAFTIFKSSRLVFLFLNLYYWSSMDANSGDYTAACCAYVRYRIHVEKLFAFPAWFGEGRGCVCVVKKRGGGYKYKTCLF